MADASGLRRLVTEYGRTVHDKASESIANQVSANTPRITGRLERARRRRDTLRGTTFVATLEQPGGAGEPDALPNWLDEGRSFEIRPVRAKVLRFRGLGGQVVYRVRVQWRPRPGSVGFWSRAVNPDGWRDALGRAQDTTSVGPS